MINNRVNLIELDIEDHIMVDKIGFQENQFNSIVYLMGHRVV